MFHKEGYFIIVFTFLFCAGLALGAEYFVKSKGLTLLLQSASLIILILVLQFFRNPKRNTVLNDQHILSPVDGKVDPQL